MTGLERHANTVFSRTAHNRAADRFGYSAKNLCWIYNESLYHTQVGFAILVRQGSGVDIKFLLAVLNSSLMNFYHRQRFLDKEKVTFQKVLSVSSSGSPGGGTRASSSSNPITRRRARWTNSLLPPGCSP